jgi:uncharacterized protein (TIGR00369 family)
VKLTEAIAAAKASGDLAPALAAIPYMRFLGLTVRDSAEGLLCILPADPKLIGNPMLPALHGGVVGALLESAAILQLLWTQEAKRVPKTIDLSIDYLRSARPVETYALARVTKLGRRVANVRAEAWQEDPSRPVAAAHGHFLLS